MPNLGIINWIGDYGTGDQPHVTGSRIDQILGDAELVTLATGLGAYTLCNNASRSVNTSTSVNPAAPSASANVDEKGIIYMRDTVTNKTISVTIPAWDVASKPLDPTGAGDRILKADVDAITALVATATGRTLVGVWGKHIKKT